MDTNCDAPTVLEAGEGVFDPVSRLERVFIEVDRLLSIATSGNAGLDSHRFQIASYPVCVVAAVGDKKLYERHRLDKFLEALEVADIAAGEVEADGSSLRARKHGQLGGGSAHVSSGGPLSAHFGGHAL